MSEFFTWTMLGSYAGAVLATTVITQLLKGLSFIDRMPTRLFSYIVATALLLLAGAFTCGLNWERAALAFINGAVVALAANGAFDAIKPAAKAENGGGYDA